MNSTMQMKPQVSGMLGGRSVAFLTSAGGAAQAEAVPPREAVAAAGGRAVLVHPDDDEARLFEQFELAEGPPPEVGLRAADVADYDALLISGDHGAEDPLFQDPAALQLATAFFLAGKPIAALCRAPAMLARAGLVRERMLTSWPGLAGEIEAAGGTWHDCPVVVCRCGPNVLITGRGPRDMPEFCAAVVEQVAQAARRSDDAGAG